MVRLTPQVQSYEWLSIYSNLLAIELTICAVAIAYPRIFDRQIPPHAWLADHVATHVQRDVRQLLNVGDLRAFTNFLQLCAGRTAGETHLSRLGADAGISHNTAKAWLCVLEASYLPPLSVLPSDGLQSLLPRQDVHFSNALWLVSQIPHHSSVRFAVVVRESLQSPQIGRRHSS